MLRNLLTTVWTAIILSSCVSTSQNSNHGNSNSTSSVNTNVAQVDLPSERKPDSLTNLPRTQDGGFVLAPGYYEAEFKTYCLQPGTPDPSPRDAYLQAPVSGYRKEIVETVLYNSRRKPDIKQRNVQLLLWSIVSGSNFNKLSSAVQADAMQLLTPKQVFELKGGVLGVVKTVAAYLPSDVAGSYNDVNRLFEMGTASYEAYERIAVLREASQLKRADFKNDQWYKQKENYYVRYFPVSYQKVRMQVYVPDGILDSTGKASGEYVVFNPIATQAIPANSNAQRLGVGGPLLDIVRIVIEVNKKTTPPPTRFPEKTKTPEDKKNKKSV
jgi:hypothetical protein